MCFKCFHLYSYLTAYEVKFFESGFVTIVQAEKSFLLSVDLFHFTWSESLSYFRSESTKFFTTQHLIVNHLV